MISRQFYFLLDLFLIVLPINADLHTESKRRLLEELTINWKTIYHAFAGVNDFTCFAKPIHYPAVFVSRWTSVVKRKETILNVLDLSCPGSDLVIDQVNQNKLWSISNKWFLLDADLTDPRLVKSFIHIYSRVLIAIPEGVQSFHIMEIFKKDIFFPLKGFSKGRWHKKHYNWDNVRFNADRFDLSGVMINTSIVFADPKSEHHIHDLVDKHTDDYSKVNVYLLEHALEFFHNPIWKKYIRPRWGFNFPNGTSTELMGDVKSGKTEINLSSNVPNYARISFMDILAKTIKYRVAFMVRLPSLSFIENIYLLPFSLTVWLSCASVIIFISIMIYFTIRIEHNFSRQDTQETVAYGETWMMLISLICQQGSSINITGFSTRIIFLFLLVFIIFIYTSYTAYIVVLLQSTSNSINTIKDLWDYGFEFGGHDINYNHRVFKEFSELDSLRTAIYRRMLKSGKKGPQGKGGFYSLEEGIEKMRNEMFAFHCSHSSGFQQIQNTWTEREKCTLRDGIFYIGDRDIVLYIWLRKGTFLRENYHIIFRRMTEVGLTERNVKRSYTTKPQCDADSSSFVSVGLMDSYPAFIIIIIGYLFAMIILFFERISKRWEDKQMRREQGKIK